MKRLSLYLVRLFASDALALFGIMLVLLWMTQWLRLFDVVASKGQSMLTLFGQSALTLPPLAIVFLYVCMGIGLGRALTRLQANHELHIIHASRQVPALFAAVMIYAALGGLFILFISNVVSPYATRQLNDWSASIAADLVSRTLTPHHFTEVVPGVVIAIGARGENGQITDFFADDSRDPEMRRTYIAKSAEVGQDEQGYVLRLHEGALQYAARDHQFSQISFGQYNIAIQRLTGAADTLDDLDTRGTFDLVSQGLATGTWPVAVVRKLAERWGEALRVLAMCLFVTALAGLPHARRGRPGVPIELTVLVAAFIERAVSAYAPLPPAFSPLAGATLLLAVSMAVLAWRFRVFRPAPMRRAIA